MKDEFVSNLRNTEKLEVPAVLVMAGGDGAAALGGTMSDPVSIPVRIEFASPRAAGSAPAPAAPSGPVVQPGHVPALDASASRSMAPRSRGIATRPLSNRNPPRPGEA